MKHLFALIAVIAVIAAASVIMRPTKANAAWRTDYDQALQEAAREGRFVLLNFTGSDWCQPCMALDRDVFSREPFGALAEDRINLVKLDFPRRKEQSSEERQRNESLARKYEIEGFPSIIILNTEGVEVARQTGYQPGAAEDYLKWLNGALAAERERD